MKEFLIAASRGRPLNSTKRNQQRLEINKHGVCNSLTTVLKDNLVIEISYYEVLKE